MAPNPSADCSDRDIATLVVKSSMSMAYKPAGYTSAALYLIVRDANRTLAFVEAVSHAKRLRVIPGEHGKGISHAEARIDDTVVMMGEQSDGPDSHVHAYLQDVEAASERAVQAGGTVVQALQRKGDWDLRGGIADGDGCIWWLARQDGA